MMGFIVLIFNAGAAALSIYSKSYYLLPINIAMMLVGLAMMLKN